MKWCSSMSTLAFIQEMHLWHNKNIHLIFILFLDYRLTIQVSLFSLPWIAISLSIDILYFQYNISQYYLKMWFSYLSKFDFYLNVERINNTKT